MWEDIKQYQTILNNIKRYQTMLNNNKQLTMWYEYLRHPYPAGGAAAIKEEKQ